ncbi:MAG: phosphopentomutase [Eubacteriales bacterium]
MEIEMHLKRIFLIVLDSLGAGEAPDAEKFGDSGASTLKSLWRTGLLDIPNLQKMGIGNIPGLGFLSETEAPHAAVGRMTEASAGKDTTIGHWEIAGVISEKPLPTFPDGFDETVISEFEKITGRGVLCNKPYSGTQVIRDYGREHLETGKLIVYTSADSVFQIAAHKDVLPVDKLYDICRRTRAMLKGKYGVGRVIARPFYGKYPDFVRSPERHDFSLEPPRPTLCDAVKNAGLDCIAVGKISDIFAARGFTEAVFTKGNDEGMRLTSEISERDFHGLCFVNLVDFDMLYGHRRDSVSYTEALNRFDAWLGKFVPTLTESDVLMITADHGCDPDFTKTTDHTREYTPLIVYGRKIAPVNFGTRATFADIAAEISEMLGIDFQCDGEPIGLGRTDREV